MPARVVLCRMLVCAGWLLALAPVASADDAVHVVQPGETLSAIAADAGVDQDALGKLNGLADANVLKVGQSLKLVAAAPAGPTSKTYTVVDGDTLWDIAMRFSTTTAAIVDANHMEDADRLRLGAQLVIPGGGTPATARTSATTAPTPGAARTTVTAAPAPAAGRATEAAVPTGVAAAQPKPSAPMSASRRTLLVPYTVQAGETLNGIARQFEISADAIVKSTGLEDPNRLAIGTVLKVPLPGHEHTVVAGETLRDIALQEKVDLGSLIDFNDLDDPELIRVGQVVLVPPSGGPATATASAPSTPSVSAAAQDQQAATAPKPTATAPKPTATAPKPTATAPKASATPAPKPSAPVVVVAPPKDAPKDGLAGAALKLLGSPYVWGGSSPAGFDCSGFIWYVAKQSGRPLSRGMLGEYNSGSHPGRDELKAGDLVFFQNTYSPGLSHNGIYIGNNQFVHAADEAAGVTISSLNTAYWSSHWFGATRLP